MPKNQIGKPVCCRSQLSCHATTCTSQEKRLFLELIHQANARGATGQLAEQELNGPNPLLSLSIMSGGSGSVFRLLLLLDTMTTKITFGDNLPGYIVGASDAPGIVLLQVW